MKQNAKSVGMRRILASSSATIMLTLGCVTVKAQPAGDRVIVTAPKGFSSTANGVRLEGFPGKPARVQLPPQLDVSALVIGLDRRGNDIQQVRAVTSVNFKINSPARNGNAPLHVEATCNNATLDPKMRVLTLAGGVNGFYQIGDGPRNPLKTNRATLRYLNNNLNVALEGGTRLEVSGADFGRPDVGIVVITSTTGANLDQSSGVARFVGNARAVSRGGTNLFDVAANEFILTRSANGTIDNLKTSGRTKIKIDLPPEPAVPNTPNAPANASSGIAGNLGRPTRVDVVSDSATLTGQNQTLILEGNVVGSYVLAPPNTAPATYNFSGERAVLRFLTQPEGETPAGLNVYVKSAQLQMPNFNLGL